MDTNILVYFSLFISFLSAAFCLYLFSLKRRINNRGNNVRISGQRERIESQIYEMNKIMLAEPERLFDNTKLLLEFPDKDLVINKTIPNNSFFSNLGVNVSNISMRENTVFCLMPFHKNFNKIYETISQTCKEAGYQCLRSDDIYNPGKILQQIIMLMFESQLIVAVLDGKNPNVFYEIGIAHSIGKTVILVANLAKVEDIPFDLRSDRFILYINHNDLKQKLSNVFKNIHYA